MAKGLNIAPETGGRVQLRGGAGINTSSFGAILKHSLHLQRRKTSNMRNMLTLAFATAGLFASVSAAPFPPTPPGTIFCALTRLGAPIVVSNYFVWILYIHL